MLYSEYRTKYLKNKVLEAYKILNQEEKKLTIPEIQEKETGMHKYLKITVPINKLVEMGRFDFDVDSSLEKIEGLIRKTI